MAKNATIHSKAAGPLIVLLIFLSSSLLVSGQDPKALVNAKEDNLALEDVSPLEATADGMLRGSGTGDAWQRELNGCFAHGDCASGHFCCERSPAYRVFCAEEGLSGPCERRRQEGESCFGFSCEYNHECYSAPDGSFCRRKCSQDNHCGLGDYSWCRSGTCTLGEADDGCRTHNDCKADNNLSCHGNRHICRTPTSYECIYQMLYGWNSWTWGAMNMMDTDSTQNVYIARTHYGNNQRWNYDSSTNVIKDKMFGYCLDVKTTDPSKWNVYGNRCHNKENQKFYMDKKQRIRSYRYEHKCLDRSSSGNLYMGNCHDGNNQKFSVPSNFADNFFRDHYGYGVIKIKSHSDECIDERLSQCIGSVCPVHSSDCHYGNNQFWTWEPENADNPYWGSIKNRNSGNCLRIWSSEAEVWPCDGSDREKWRIDSSKRLRNKHDSGKCLKRRDDGSGFYLTSCGDNNEKKFIMESDIGMGRVLA